MTCIMRMLSPPELEGQFLHSFIFDAEGGNGYGVFTHDPAEAKRFAHAGEAFQFWNTQSTVKPLRADGKPNKPLSASTVEIVTL